MAENNPVKCCKCSTITNKPVLRGWIIIEDKQYCKECAKKHTEAMSKFEAIE